MADRNDNALKRITETWLERADVAIYAMIAVLFLAAAMAMGAPFLYNGIISATRRILAIGAATTLGAATSETAFHHQMIDLGANGGVVLALAIALFLFSGQRPAAPTGQDDDATERWA